MKTLFEKSRSGSHAISFPILHVPHYDFPEELMRRRECSLPELSEPEIVQHYIELSGRNFGIDNGFYPLGSCTMKYNPKINDELAALDGFALLHPLAPARLCQGALELMHELETYLRDLTGFARFTLQPAAGAQAEFTALLIMKAWFQSCGQTHRNQVLIPDVAHGTNPASVKLAGWEAIEVKT